MSKRTFVNLIFFLGVFFVMLWWAANNIVSIDAIERPYRIKGEFTGAFGITPNSEVAYLGTHYGTVTGVELEAGKVVVTMAIDRGAQIPAGSTAFIARKSAVGEPFVDFAPPEDYDGEEEGPYIEEGEVVPLERTSVPLQFSELLRAASELISGISPEHTGNLIHELALAFEGRGDSLNRLTRSGDRLTASFAERTDMLDRLATNGTRITHVFAEHRGAFGESLTNLRELSESLRNAEGDIERLLEVGPEFVGTIANLVADQKGNLDCLLGDLVPIISLTAQPEKLDGLRTTLVDGPTAFNQIAGNSDIEPDGIWLRANFLAATGSPPPVYVPHRELPPVPGVPGCSSAMTPYRGAGDFTPSQAAVLGRAGGGLSTLPATGGPALATVAALLLAAAFVTRRVAARRAGGDGPDA